MQVRDIIAHKQGKDVVTIRDSADMAMVASVLLGHHIGGLVVLDGAGALKGFVSERDVVRGVHRSSESTGRMKVSDVMQRPAPTCSVTDDLDSVARRMNRERLRHLVVIEGERVVGVLSVGDFLKHRLTELEMEAGVLRDYVSAQRARHG